MKKKLIIFLTAILLIFANVKTANASTVSGSLSTSLSSSSVVLGNQVTYYINISCQTEVGGGLLYLSYDSTALTLSSYNLNGSGSMSGNNVVIDYNQKTSVSFSFTFTTKKIGSTNIQLTAKEMIDGNGNDISCSTYKSNTVNVEAKTNTYTPTTTSLSSDASVASLTINNAQLEESFSSGVYEYKIYTTSDVTSLDLQANASSSKATVSVKNNELKQGWNEVDIVCTAQDSSTKTYKLNVYVEETPTVYFNDDSLGVVKNLDKVTSPEGFSQQTITVEENDLVIYQHENLKLIYLADNENNKNFYIYDSVNNQILGVYNPISIDGKNYLAMDFEYENINEMDKEDYSPITVTIGDHQIAGWKYKAKNMGEYRILYLMDENGDYHLYSYELTQKTLQLFAIPEQEEVEEETTTDLNTIIAYCVGGSGAACFLISLFMINKKKKLSN